MGEPFNALELKGIYKSFPGVNALQDVNLDIRKGEIHAIVGENGAGKSTLIKIITGYHKMDSGTMFIDGEETVFQNPHQSIGKGISCIYQELSIVPLMDVANNIYIGSWPEKSGFIDNSAFYNGAAKILERINLEVSPRAQAGDLSIAQQQMVEIGRALTRDAKVIIMDEPTSSLTDRESEILFGLIGKLREEGVSIVYISHKLNEVLKIADRISVLCDGKNVTTVDAKDTDRARLIEYMLGRALDNMFSKQETEIGEPILKVEGLTKKGVFNDVSFEVRRGEIVGFFGLIGAGRTEIMRAIFGIDKYDSGDIYIDGKKTLIRSSRSATRRGIAMIPENRKREGLALSLSVTENMSLAMLPFIKKGPFIDGKKRETQTARYIGELGIKTPSGKQLAGNLSGGNQQKVVIAKWLMRDPLLLILDEPTRGIDVGSKAEIYTLICALADRGVGIIVVSSELQEILGLSDRVVAVYEGRVTAQFDDIGAAADKAIMNAALGGESV